jgi:hypothetical protein
MLIDDDILKEHSKNLLSDSGFESFKNNHYVTEKNLNLYIGYNKRHQKTAEPVIKATDEDIIEYKKRGIVENVFGNIQRYPIIINNYQRKTKSYEGLLKFVLCILLAQKINKIISEKDKIKNKEEIEQEIKRKEEEKIKRKEKYKKYIEKKEKQKKEDDKKRQLESDKIRKGILKKIYKNNTSQIEEQLSNTFNKCIQNKILKRKEKK